MVIRPAVFPRKSSGGRGLPRITPATEQMVRDVINDVQQPTPNRRVPEIIAEVQRRCLELQLRPPLGQHFTPPPSGFIHRAAGQQRLKCLPARAMGPVRSPFAQTAARP